MPLDYASIMTALSVNSDHIKVKKPEPNGVKENELTEIQLEVLSSIVEKLKEPDLDSSKRQCPECGRNFDLIDIDADTGKEVKTVQIDVCRFCRSLWFDAGELKAITLMSKDVPSQDLASRKSKYKCPVCKNQMNEYVFKAPDNVLVDQCLDGHGVYLESGELLRVLRVANK
ncbi:MAG: zf-TFIIB domain-containing protein [bacterium]|nr:zf-TFIIB domain-containing protein [bacterium]